MRWVLLLVMLLLSSDIRAATENSEGRDYAKALDADNLLFLKELTRLIGAQGYRHVEIIPQLFVAKATGPDGQDRTLIINSDTLKAYSFEGKLPVADKGAPPETALPGLH
jgi:hypothetical protein